MLALAVSTFLWKASWSGFGCVWRGAATASLVESGWGVTTASMVYGVAGECLCVSL